MAHAWMNVVYLTDAEYEAWVAEHKAKKPSTQNQQ
jgi:heme/copper-type cytochrome/quinol oxidase subunit 2